MRGRSGKGPAHYCSVIASDGEHWQSGIIEQGKMMMSLTLCRVCTAAGWAKTTTAINEDRQREERRSIGGVVHWCQARLNSLNYSFRLLAPPPPPPHATIRQNGAFLDSSSATAVGTGALAPKRWHAASLPHHYDCHYCRQPPNLPPLGPFCSPPLWGISASTAAKLCM